ncbi:esterase family protein [Tenacibaculum aiptasiae]|uniref:Esterase family protein n=1 Tax=Tenacibaculum aiptasiae TaxID=426481 RepID=A0A7J5ASB4_9FLAO|nr:alpha/beta hydrolase-fold protein [Tenacibaculum aiptasiae]KAB1160525.1 esterase family protein [Tenacibaculum aiptasiae]
MNSHFKFTILTLLLFLISFQNTILAQKGKELVVNTSLEKAISAGENHIYTAQLDNGMAIIGKVTQKGIDLVVDVYKPSGELLKQIDSPNGTNGDEPIDITANQSGIYKFVIRSLDKNAKRGKYSLTVKRVLSLQDNTKRIAKRELPTETLYNLWESSLTNNKAIDAFIAKHQQKHIIEPIKGSTTHMLVTYFCVPNKNTEYVMLSGGPDFLGLRFQKLPNTNLFFVTQRVPKDARFNYGFNYFNLDKAGPNGEIESRTVEHAYDGTIEMPNAPKQSYITERENVKKGTLLPTTIKSKYLNEERKITIHTPANYDAKKPHNLLIVFDGESYGARLNRRSRIPTSTIIDNLIADKKITQTVTILVWAMGKRSRDLISEKFGDFIAKELIPWTRSKYNIHSTPNNIVLAGSSRGGFAASYIALRYPNIIGNVLSQSGSYWIKGTKNENHWIYPEDNGKLINLYKQSKKLPIRFYMDVGLYDAGASMLGMNRQFRDILEIKGYQVDYHEFKGGHNYVNWRGTLANGLISLIGTK